MEMFLEVMLVALTVTMLNNIQPNVQKANQFVESNWLPIGSPEVTSISKFAVNAEPRYCYFYRICSLLSYRYKFYCMKHIICCIFN